MITLPSRLDDETEKCISEAMDCGFAVHKAIGPGYRESIYKNAFCLELLARQIPFDTEKTFTLAYRGRPALLMNFGGATLKEGLQRIVL